MVNCCNYARIVLCSATGHSGVLVQVLVVLERTLDLESVLTQLQTAMVQQKKRRLALSG